jgi:hypothetical protein
VICVVCVCMCTYTHNTDHKIYRVIDVCVCFITKSIEITIWLFFFYFFGANLLESLGIYQINMKRVSMNELLETKFGFLDDYFHRQNQSVCRCGVINTLLPWISSYRPLNLFPLWSRIALQLSRWVGSLASFRNQQNGDTY